MVRLALSEIEFALIEEIRDFGYGDIFEIDVPPAVPTKVYELDQQECNLIRALRLNGKLDRLVVHDGLPSIAEKKCTVRGKPANKKIKF
jgi:hypothetical protein